LFEFCVRDGEDRTFDEVFRVAGEFKVAVIGSAARDDEVVIVNPYDS